MGSLTGSPFPSGVPCTQVGPGQNSPSVGVSSSEERICVRLEVPVCLWVCRWVFMSVCVSALPRCVFPQADLWVWSSVDVSLWLAGRCV